MGSFRVEVEDVTASGTGTIEVDGWFTLSLMCSGERSAC